MDKTVYIIGCLAGIWAGGFLLWRALCRSSTLWGSARIVYIVISLLEFYHAIIYGLVIFGTLSVTQYGAYLRPVVSIYLIAPALIAIIHQRGGKL